jgi:catalase
MRVQFYVDEATTPIEDASVEWKEKDAPFVTVARLTLPKQDIDGAGGRRIADFIEGLSFDPWHALEAHRPLGNVMRARGHAYRLSTNERGAAREPDGTEQGA